MMISTINMNIHFRLPVFSAWVVLWLSTGYLLAQTPKEDALAVSFTSYDSLLIYRLTCKKTSFIDLNEKVNVAYRRFKDTFTTEQLVVLTDYADACVRAYAFNVLVEREYDALEGIIKKHINDTLSIKYPAIGGDVIDKKLLIQFMIGKAPLDEAILKKYSSQVSKKLYKVEIPAIDIDPEALEEDSIRR